MSLKTDYFDGLTGLHANLNNAFNVGVALIGTGVTEISSLDLGDRNGSNMGVAPAGATAATFTGQVAGMTSAITLTANTVGTNGNAIVLTGNGTLTITQLIAAWNGTFPGNQVTLSAGDGTQVPDNAAALQLAGGTNNVAQPGIYFDVDGPGNGYRFWMSVSGQVAPASAGRQLVQVGISSAASRAEAASSINDAILAVSGSPFKTTMIGDSIRIETSTPKTVANSIALSSSGWGLAVVAVVQVGSDSTGNYATIRQALLDNASQGATKFTVTVTASLNPTALRANKGNNLLLKAYLAGITKGLSDQQLYSYEVTPALNVSDTVATYIDLNFAFQIT